MEKDQACEEANRVINGFGGTRKVATLCGLTDGAVSQWRTNGIPRGFRLFLKSRKPRLFDDPRTATGKRKS